MTAGALGLGARSAVGAPISVEGRLWGAMQVASPSEAGLPIGAEQRLAGFTELAATAIANAEAHTALMTSRARIVATADETSYRIERDLHDGARQRLVSSALQLRAAQASVPPGLGPAPRRAGPGGDRAGGSAGRAPARSPGGSTPRSWPSGVSALP